MQVLTVTFHGATVQKRSDVKYIQSMLDSVHQQRNAHAEGSCTDANLKSMQQGQPLPLVFTCAVTEISGKA